MDDVTGVFRAPPPRLADKAQAGILRARPIAGPIDHAALSREAIARFPKIRAALAKG